MLLVRLGRRVLVFHHQRRCPRRRVRGSFFLLLFRFSPDDESSFVYEVLLN